MYTDAGWPLSVRIPIILRTFSPLPPLLSFALPANATIGLILLTLIQQLRLPAKVAQMLRLTRLGGQSVATNTTVGQLGGMQLVQTAQGPAYAVQPLNLEVRMGIRGGKGGFGSMLRAQGGKMSAGRRKNGEENNDSCRDLNGRRLSTMKQAKLLAEHLASQDERKREMDMKQKAKYAKLEKMLGRKPSGAKDFEEAARRLDEQGGALDDDDSDGVEREEGDDKGEGSSKGSGGGGGIGSGVTATKKKGNEQRGTKRERIDDHEYIEQSREIVDNVRSAVAAAMMKNKKKKKTTKQTTASPSHGEASASASQPKAQTA